MSVRKRNLILVGVFVLIAAILGTVWFLSRPAVNVGDKTLNITVTSPAGETSSYAVSTDAEFLWDAMYPEHIDGNDTEYGKWITSVDGDVADEAAGQYWLFTKGGEWVETSCDTTPIADGESYEFFIYES